MARRSLSANDTALQRQLGSLGFAVRHGRHGEGGRQISDSDSVADRRAGPDAVLTNADVVQMQKAGLSEQIILSKIGTSTSKFNAGTQDLIQLKERECPEFR